MQDILASGHLLPALVIALAAGALSFFSPCVLPLVPGYLAYVGGTAAQPSLPQKVGVQQTGAQSPAAVSAYPANAHPAGKLLLGTTLFILGFTLVFVAFFSLAGTVGAWLLVHERLISSILGAVIIVLGLVFAGWIRPLQRTVKLRIRPAVGVAGAPLLGAAFALGWTPCIGPALSVIFALSLQEGTAVRGALLAVAYCLGLGLPFLAAAAGLGAMGRVSGWVRKHMRQLNLTGAALLVIIGVLMLTGVWTQLLYALQAWLNAYTPLL